MTLAMFSDSGYSHMIDQISLGNECENYTVTDVGQSEICLVCLYVSVILFTFNTSFSYIQYVAIKYPLKLFGFSKQPLIEEFSHEILHIHYLFIST